MLILVYLSAYVVYEKKSSITIFPIDVPDSSLACTLRKFSAFIGDTLSAKVVLSLF